MLRHCPPLLDFLKEHENTGTQAADIYFKTKINGERKWMKACFPGCTPGQCKKTASKTPLKVVPPVEWERYAYSSETSVDIFNIAHQTINGVKYFAELGVTYDYRKRVISYGVISYREPITDKERGLIRQFQGRLKGIRVFHYGKNVSLGVDASTFRPRPNSSYVDDLKEI